jgi:hypothetical protein
MRAHEFIFEAAFRPANLKVSPEALDWPVDEKLIGKVNVTIMNHFYVRCADKGATRADQGYKVDKNTGFEVVRKLCTTGKLFRNLPNGKLWVWDEALHHSIGGVKQLDHKGVMQFQLKTILAKYPWDSDTENGGIKVYTV